MVADPIVDHLLKLANGFRKIPRYIFYKIHFFDRHAKAFIRKKVSDLSSFTLLAGPLGVVCSFRAYDVSITSAHRRQIIRLLFIGSASTVADVFVSNRIQTRRASGKQTWCHCRLAIEEGQ